MSNNPLKAQEPQSGETTASAYSVPKSNQHATADTDSQLHNILNRLDNVQRGGRGYTARCPAHTDRRNSLSIGLGEDNRILVNCFAGCSAKEIVEALGLVLRDLFSRS